MRIRTVRSDDLPALSALWDACGRRGDVLWLPLDTAAFADKFLSGEGRDPEYLLVAEAPEGIAGMIHGVAPGSFRGGKPGWAYLSCLLTAPDFRRQGVAGALLAALEEKVRAAGAEVLAVSSLNPVNLSWRIPDTPGHDHNNMPGVDDCCEGAGFFPRMGFAPRHHEVAMYLPLAGWRISPRIGELRQRLAEQGIEAGPYDAGLDCDFDRMCDRVGSDYWRDVLRTEIAAWKAGEPNADARFWADGVRPRDPRTLLTAVHDRYIVGFTGPVDRQRSGRGWFTGICTDPEYGQRGIATVLFSLLMQAFAEEGAAFSTLFTGTENPAQKIYLAAGMRPVRSFTLMTKDLR